jgi:hypothetical protein
MPLLVYKSSSVEALDDFFSGTRRELRRAHEFSRDLLAQFEGQPLSETTAVIERGKEGPDIQGATTHFREHWLSGPLGGPNVDRVMRHAYREAIRLAGDRPRPLPIETFWVAGAGSDFEMQICEGARAITVFVFIPETAGGSENAGARTWAIRPDPVHDPGAERLDDLDPPIVKRRVSGPPAPRR